MAKEREEIKGKRRQDMLIETGSLWLSALALHTHQNHLGSVLKIQFLTFCLQPPESEFTEVGPQHQSIKISPLILMSNEICHPLENN